MVEADEVFQGGFRAADGYPHGVTNGDQSITVRRSTRDCKIDEVDFLIDYCSRYFEVRGKIIRDDAKWEIEIQVSANEFASHALRRSFAPPDRDALELFNIMALGMNAAIASGPDGSRLRGKRRVIRAALLNADGSVIKRV